MWTRYPQVKVRLPDCDERGLWSTQLLSHVPHESAGQGTFRQLFCPITATLNFKPELLNIVRWDRLFFSAALSLFGDAPLLQRQGIAYLADPVSLLWKHCEESVCPDWWECISRGRARGISSDRKLKEKNGFSWGLPVGWCWLEPEPSVASNKCISLKNINKY